MRRVIRIAAAFVAATSCVACSSLRGGTGSPAGTLATAADQPPPAPLGTAGPAVGASSPLPALPKDSGRWDRAGSDTWTEVSGAVNCNQPFAMDGDLPLVHSPASFDRCDADHLAWAILGSGDSARWAIYRLPRQSESYKLDSLSLFLSGYDSEVYALLSNYKDGIWEAFGPLRYLDQSLYPGDPYVIAPAEGFADYANEGGYSYIAFYATGGLTAITGFVTHAETSMFLATPTGFRAMKLEDGGYLFEWDAYGDEHAGGFSILGQRPTPPPPPPGSPPPNPGSVIEYIICGSGGHAYLHEDTIEPGVGYTLRAFSAELGLHSDPSNSVYPEGEL